MNIIGAYGGGGETLTVDATQFAAFLRYWSKYDNLITSGHLRRTFGFFGENGIGSQSWQNRTFDLEETNNMRFLFKGIFFLF